MKYLFCKLFNHEFEVKKKVTEFVNEYQCIHCGEQFTTSDKGSLTPLTKKRKETNRVLESLHHKRKHKRKLYS